MRVSGPYSLDDVRATYKKRDAWWTVLLVDPLAGRLVAPIANRTNLTPNQLTLVAGLIGFGAAAAFLEGSRPALIVGALLFHLSFVVDCMDGKIARLKGTGTVFGTWLDYVLDRVKVAVCALALMTGQYLRTDQVIYLYLAMLVLFAEMIRYIDVARIRDTRIAMARRIKRAARHASGEETPGSPVVGHADVDGEPDHEWDPLAVYQKNPLGAINRDFNRRFGAYGRFRSMLLRHRIRTHLWSGIEFEMFVFIVGPLTGQVIAVTIASAALLFVFEAAIIYKLWLSTRNFTRVMADLDAAAAPQAENPERPAEAPLPPMAGDSRMSPLGPGA